MIGFRRQVNSVHFLIKKSLSHNNNEILIIFSKSCYMSLDIFRLKNQSAPFRNSNLCSVRDN